MSDGNGHPVTCRIHLDIIGPAGGDFDVSVGNGVFRARRGIPRPPDATVSVEAFLALLARKDEIRAAAADGRVRIQGTQDAVSAFCAAVDGFHVATTMNSVAGEIARGLQRWCSR